MDYQKSYALLWVGLIAGFVLMLIGGSLEIGWLLWLGAAVFMAVVLQTLLFFRCPLRRTLGSPGRHSPLLSALRGVHSVKILSYR